MTPGATVSPRPYELLRALAYGQTQRANAIAAGLGEADRVGEELVLGVAFIHALGRRFGRQPDDRDIDRLAAEAVTWQANGPHLADVGRLIRPALDQPHLAAHNDPTTRTDARRPVLRARRGRRGVHRRRGTGRGPMAHAAGRRGRPSAEEEVSRSYPTRTCT